MILLELQKDICHTDEAAWHKHATSSKTGLLKDKEPKTEHTKQNTLCI